MDRAGGGGLAGEAFVEPAGGVFAQDPEAFADFLEEAFALRLVLHVEHGNRLEPAPTDGEYERVVALQQRGLVLRLDDGLGALAGGAGAAAAAGDFSPTWGAFIALVALLVAVIGVLLAPHVMGWRYGILRSGSMGPAMPAGATATRFTAPSPSEPRGRSGCSTATTRRPTPPS